MTAGNSTKRINEKLREYWGELSRGRAMPHEDEFNPDVISDIWADCFLVSLWQKKQEQGYRYNYLGKSLIDAFGSDMTDKEVSARLIDPSAPPLVRRFDEVAASGKPLEAEDEFTNKDGVTIKYRTCLLPLGKEGVQGVAYILGGMKWKPY